MPNLLETQGSLPPINSPILVRDLPRLLAPITAYVHERRPAVIVANDRGARLAGLALAQSYHAAYAAPLPTHSGQLNFLRISKTQSDTAPIASRLRELTANDAPASLELLLLDDWVTTGVTVSRFVEAANAAGITTSKLAVATLCGQKAEGVEHIVGDPLTLTTNSIWNAYEEVTGVAIVPGDARGIAAQPNKYAQQARVELAKAVSAYYASPAR
ncbi:MAG: hypothetical protein JWN82_604 [Candidatus Saccharibacteria bacterium]|nr:hypothetical protein [Candidatus Saccharibacteria bacterium]